MEGGRAETRVSRHVPACCAKDGERAASKRGPHMCQIQYGASQANRGTPSLLVQPLEETLGPTSHRLLRS